MASTLTFAVGFATGYAVGVGAGGGTRASAVLGVLRRTAQQLPDVQQWASGLSSAASTAAHGARTASRQAIDTLRPQGAASAGSPASGGVIPLKSVPIDQLSEWELDLLTTPDPSQ